MRRFVSPLGEMTPGLSVLSTIAETRRRVNRSTTNRRLPCNSSRYWLIFDVGSIRSATALPKKAMGLGVRHRSL